MARLDMLLEFVRAKPDDAFACYGLAMEYKNLGRLEEAKEAFATLAARHPSYTAAYLHAGNTLVALGRREEARAVFQAGIAACVQKGDGHAQSELQSALEAL